MSIQGRTFTRDQIYIQGYHNPGVRRETCRTERVQPVSVGQGLGDKCQLYP
jgi:hypothetical protein